jgi:hypothetical protein
MMKLKFTTNFCIKPVESNDNYINAKQYSFNMHFSGNVPI